MPDEILGIPLHPLVVHAAVVLVPLTGVGTLLVAAVPGWRRTYGWLVVIFSAIAAITVPVATRSGKWLAEVRYGEALPERVLDHQEMGDRVIWAVVPLLVLNVAMMLMIRARRPSAQVTAVAVAASLAAVAAIVLVVLTGHLGSENVWNPSG
jgi:uncharacterized membrane protein